MRKILIVTCKDLTSKNYDGGKKRILDVAEFLSKKNQVDAVCISSNNIETNEKQGIFNKIEKFKINFFTRILNSLIYITRMEPMQNGFFYSKEMYKFIEENENKYNTIIFHLTRSAQYLPNYFQGKKILEMTDLVSFNYSQIVKKTSAFNPLKYIYFLEKIFLTKYEKRISEFFDNIVFISQNEFLFSKKIIDKNKIKIIGNSVKAMKILYKHKKNNNKILFVGNINYTPNKLACFNFSNNVLPEIKKFYPGIEFAIVGKINFIDKIYLGLKRNVKIYGPLEKLDKLIKESICGICNLEVSSGIQNKIFTYMSYGLPVISSQNSFPKVLLKNKQILVYKNDKQFLEMVLKLIKNKNIAKKISKNSFGVLKNKFSLNKAYVKYLKIV